LFFLDLKLELNNPKAVNYYLLSPVTSPKGTKKLKGGSVNLWMILLIPLLIGIVLFFTTF